MRRSLLLRYLFPSKEIMNCEDIQNIGVLSSYNKKISKE